MSKLRHCVIGKTKDQLINFISSQSETKYGEKLIDFLNTYGIYGLQEAKIEQLQEYISNKLCPQNNKEVEK